MPELPEVETIRRQLEPELVGRRIESVEVLDERLTRPVSPREVERACAGRRIESVERRGKYLILRLDGERSLVMHLRMTGNLVLGGPRADPLHLRALIRLESGGSLLFTDTRRFGTAVVLDDDDLEEYMAPRAGIEPLSEGLTAEEIGALAEGRRAPLKSFLLVQSGIAGIGNIYADEALWRAELHPLSPAGSMRPEHWERLRRGIVDTLEAGLANGGASIDDYRDARGEEGTMQDEFLVHTREGLPCPRCGTEIRRTVLSGRSTYFCPGCQKRLRRRRRRTGWRKAAARRR
ncbi:MAG TPA: bifunctional DNA-formamidopyrimidine glycosylase/DNA-(apurinic or apyrimidinic site) lyase [Solirubrobacterales bacterium]|nr:bifunctional DNA-formamidopyrimidine glycosylase/DNA-(apurinic or apyrimidinic site) lyase [Solirubrobacterales bacterium]